MTGTSKLVSLLALSLAAVPAGAIDGGTGGPGGGEGASSSYYEQTLAGSAGDVATLDASGASGGLPASLHVVEAAGGVEYRSVGGGGWQVKLAIAERPHERVDAVYDLVLALPLPARFASKGWSIDPRSGVEGASVPFVYGGERVRLKRNAPLEASWLPLLIASESGLPDLAGSGYAWTLWDTVLRYDANAGSTLQGFATFGYSTHAALPAPDSADARNAAFLITWIPTLEAAVPPFAIRLDVVEPVEE